MKTFNKTLIAAATVATFGLAAAPAAVALEASASVATSYLWRGQDLGQGDAALAVDFSDSYGDLTYGLWVSSGDSVLGTEYDLYATYSKEINGVGFSVGYASYIYPGSENNVEPDANGEFQDNDRDDFDENAEYIYGISYGNASATIFDAKDGEYKYTTFSYTSGPYTLTFGEHDDAEPGNPDENNDNMSHFDLSYAVNDKISLTISSVIDSDNEEDDDTTVVATYSF
jgi:hypothetical protein